MRISDWSSDVCSSDLQHLADALEFYFSQSEQLPTLLRLAYDGTHVRGLMLQRLPLGENNSSEDNWQHVSVLFKTLQEDELAATPGLRSEEHTSELQSLMRISYAVFCLKKNTKHTSQSKAR